MTDLYEVDHRVDAYARSIGQKGTSSKPIISYAQKKHKYEIHEINVLRTTTTASVSGQTSGHGIAIGGIGFGSASGSTKTKFRTHIFSANGKFVYDSADGVQFADGDNLIVLSNPKNKTTGEYHIVSFFAPTSGMKRIISSQSMEFQSAIFLIGFLVSLPLMIIIIGFITGPVCLVGFLQCFFGSSHFEHAGRVFKDVIDAPDAAERQKMISEFNGVSAAAVT